MKNKFKKIKKYFNNSPRRLGCTVLGINIFFLLLVLSVLLQRSGEIFGLSGFMVAVFPVLIFAQLQNIIPSFFDIVPIFVFSILYYSLFVILLVSAQNTNTNKFKISFLVFSVWFVFNLLYGLFVFAIFIRHGVFQ